MHVFLMPAFAILVATTLVFAPPVAAISTLAIGLGALFLAELFRRRLVATFLLGLFLLYGLFPVWAMQVVARVPLSNWRGDLFSPEHLDGAILYYATAFSVFALGALVGATLWARRIRTARPASPRGITSLRLARVAPLFMALMTLAAFLGITRDSWINSATVADRFVMQAATIGTVAAFGFNLEARRRRNLPWQPVDFVPLLAATIIALQGFRFMLVAALMTLLVAQRNRLALRPRVVAFILVSGVIAYALLILGMGVRAMSAEQGVSMLAALAQLDSAQLSKFVGTSEQTGMLALKYFLETPVPRLAGQTYLDAIPRLLPNAVHTAFFDTLRPQDYILAEFAWVSGWFRENELNVGAHLFVEAIVNFGPGPGLFVSAFAGLFVPLLDTLAMRRERLVPLLYGVASFSYAAAYYGSASFLKYTVYYSAVFMLLGVLSQFRRASGSDPSRGRGRSRVRHAGATSIPVIAGLEKRGNSPATIDE